MITNVELLFLFVFAILIVLTFRIWRRMESSLYFSFTEVIYGIQTNIPILGLIIKISIFFFAGLLITLILKSRIVAILSSGLSAFLIIWPEILKPTDIDYRVNNHRKILYLIYFLFILIAIMVSYLGGIVGVWIKPEISNYLKELSTKGVVIHIVFDFIVISVLIGFLKKALSVLNKRINA